jgi:hypothetical protein
VATSNPRRMPLTSLDLSFLGDLMRNNRIKKLEITVERQPQAGPGDQIITNTTTVATLERGDLHDGNNEPLYPALTGVFILLSADEIK